MNERTFKAADAQKLEDPERLKRLPLDEIIRALDMTAGMTIADVGAGVGYFAIPLAREAGPAGRVLAVDLQPEMLEILRGNLNSPGAPRNIQLIEGTAHHTHLNNGACDLVFLANIWHELDDLPGVLSEVRRILRPGGRVGILDWRADLASPPGPPADHRVSAEQTAGILESAAWRVLSSGHAGTHSYLIIADTNAATA